jgi:hypothetical protein
VHREGAKTDRRVRSAEIAPRVGCGIAWAAGVKTAAPPPPDDLRVLFAATRQPFAFGDHLGEGKRWGGCDTSISRPSIAG